MDIRNFINCYIFGLINIVEILECLIIFLFLFLEIINKCCVLNMDVINIEEFMNVGIFWLKLEMLVGFEVKLDFIL